MVPFFIPWRCVEQNETMRYAVPKHYKIAW